MYSPRSPNSDSSADHLRWSDQGPSPVPPVPVPVPGLEGQHLSGALIAPAPASTHIAAIARRDVEEFFQQLSLSPDTNIFRWLEHQATLFQHDDAPAEERGLHFKIRCLHGVELAVLIDNLDEDKGGWLCGDVLEGCFDLQKPHFVHDVTVLSPHLTQACFNESSRDRVPRWTDRIFRTTQWQSKSEGAVLWLPTNVQNVHWIGLEVQLSAQVIRVYDSYSKMMSKDTLQTLKALGPTLCQALDSAVPARFVGEARRSFQFEISNRGTIKFAECPQQRNQCDCGILVFVLGVARARGLEYSQAEDHTCLFRTWMAVLALQCVFGECPGILRALQSSQPPPPASMLPVSPTGLPEPCPHASETLRNNVGQVGKKAKNKRRFPACQGHGQLGPGPKDPIVRAQVATMDLLLQQANRRLQDVHRDGHCQFHAIAVGQNRLSGSPPIDFLQVRHAVSNWLRPRARWLVGDEGSATLHNFVTDVEAGGLSAQTEEGWAEFCRRIDTTSDWGNHTTLIAAANVYQRVVRVWSITNHTSEDIRPEDPLPGCIEIAHEYETHYQAVLPTCPEIPLSDIAPVLLELRPASAPAAASQPGPRVDGDSQGEGEGGSARTGLPEDCFEGHLVSEGRLDGGSGLLEDPSRSEFSVSEGDAKDGRTKCVSKSVSEGGFDQGSHGGEGCTRCMVCFGSCDGASLIKVCPKDHSVCQTCLGSAVKVAIEEDLIPLQCFVFRHDCGISLELVEFQTFLDPDLFDLASRKLAEKAVCYCPSCSAAVVWDNDDVFADNVVQCSVPGCKAFICVLCRQLDHNRQTCEQARNRASSNWQDLNVRLCPTCNTGIQRNGGCKTIRCSNCSTRFCFHCLSCNPNDCSCATFDDTSFGRGEGSSASHSILIDGDIAPQRTSKPTPPTGRPEFGLGVGGGQAVGSGDGEGEERELGERRERSKTDRGNWDRVADGDTRGGEAAVLVSLKVVEEGGNSPASGGTVDLPRKRRGEGERCPTDRGIGVGVGEGTTLRGQGIVSEGDTEKPRRGGSRGMKGRGGSGGMKGDRVGLSPVLGSGDGIDRGTLTKPQQLHTNPLVGRQLLTTFLVDRVKQDFQGT
jgi:hypothetical protein